MSGNYTNDMKFTRPSQETVENVLWVYPDEALIKESKHIVLLVHGLNNSGLQGAWSWSYAAQLPHDNFIPATISLPNMNTTDLNYSGKFVVAAVWVLKNRYPNYKISIVAHSMGNLATIWALTYRNTYLKNNIDAYVAIGAPFQGLPSGAKEKSYPAVIQGTKGSEFLKIINSEKHPSTIKYLSIISATDELATDLAAAKALATFPADIKGNVQTPQEVFKHKKSISHVGELGDSGIYEMTRAFLTSDGVLNLNAGQKDYFDNLQKEGLVLAVKYGNALSHCGDAEKVSVEPKTTDIIL